MPPEPLSAKEIENALEDLPGWSVEGDVIARKYSLGKHLPAAAMVMHVAAIQEELGHHSDMTLSYNTLALTVNTHSVGGKITELDLALARRVEQIAAAHGAS
jgi:4a-hydroxytetrahydrobiopterin dehydratase